MRISDWSSDVCSSDLGQLAAHPLAVILPCGLEAGVIAGVQRLGVTERDCAITIDRRNGKTGMRATNVHRHNLCHLANDPLHNPAAASMAEPPLSALSAPLRKDRKSVL